MGAAGGGGLIDVGEPAAVGREGFAVFGLGGEVGPLVGIVLMVVEFFAAVGVLDVAPAFGADSVVALVVGGDGGAGAGGLGIFELGKEADAFEVVARGEAAEFDEGGIEIKEFGGLFAAAIFVDAGSGEDEGDAGGAFPECIFAGDGFFAEMVAVIAPDDDDGVIGLAGLFESIEEPTDLGIDEAGGGEVGADEVAPLIVLADPLEARFGEGPMEIPGEARGIGAVVREDGGKNGVVIGIEVEPWLGDVAGDVREEETDGEEEGLVARKGAELFGGPRGDDVVLLVFIAMRKDAPIHERVVAHGCGWNEFLLGSSADATGRTSEVELGSAPARRVTAMINLAGGEGSVAVGLEVLRESDAILEGFERAEPWREAVDAGGGGAKAEHETGARGIAQGTLRVGIEEGGAAGGEPVQVRSFDKGVPAERADPVILVVDGNEEDVGRLRGSGEGVGAEGEEGEKEKCSHG